MSEMTPEAAGMSCDYLPGDCCAMGTGCQSCGENRSAARWQIEYEARRIDSTGKLAAWSWTITEGVNSYGDGPHHTVCVVESSRADAEAICAAHNGGVA